MTSAGCMGVCVHLVLMSVLHVFRWNFVTSMHDLGYIADVYICSYMFTWSNFGLFNGLNCLRFMVCNAKKQNGHLI